VSGERVRLEIHDGWTVRASHGPGVERLAGRSLPAAVPGCVHLDLLAAGVLDDPYVGDNEAAAQWVGRTDWTFTTQFLLGGVEPGTRYELVADGLDTVCDVVLNGVVVGSTRDMHRAHRFDVGTALRVGENELEVRFRAPLDEAEAATDRLGARPHVNTHPYNALRKNASSFGWDWGPDLPSSGVWRPLALESWTGARIAAVRPLVDVRPDGTGVLDVHVDLDRTHSAPLEVRAQVAGRTSTVVVPGAGTSTVVRVEVPDVALWWPRGYGGQALHDLRVSVGTDGRELDARDARIGFRTITASVEADDAGTSFGLVVNGRPILVRGYNWIPDDAFPSRVDADRYRRRIVDACESGANLLRVWGGGIYESDAFYDVCDELGVLVWQDFAFACAAYAEEHELAAEVEAEARDAVTRLSSHASLALWCGGNECLWGHEDWGWKEPLAGRTWGLGYYSGLLPSVLASLDPTRPYVPGSPFSPSGDAHPNDPAHATVHIWDVWNDRDYTAYLEYRPRFVAEFGFQGPPTWATLTRAVAPEHLDPWSPTMLVHQKAEDGNGKLERGLAPHLPAPTGIDDWHWATSLNQARAMRLGVEHFRSLAPHCRGVVVWQLNDCWPVISWAAVDGDGRRKPLWYGLRHAYADRLLTLLPDGDDLVLGVVNDTDDALRGTVAVRRLTHDGEVLAHDEVEVDVAPRSAARHVVPSHVGAPGSAAREAVVADGLGLRAVRPCAEDVDSALDDVRLDVVADRTDDGWAVSVTSHGFVRDLALLVDRLDPDAVVDDMLVTLLPGETATFRVRSDRELSAAAFADPLVLRSANQLCAAARPGSPAGSASSRSGASPRAAT
jgi:beta-mannosidase